MERLTKRYIDEDDGRKSIGAYTGCIVPEIWFEGEREYRVLDKLATYEDLEEQGLLVRLPAAIGTNAYVVGSFLDCIYDYEHCEATRKWKCGKDIQCEYEKKKYYVKEIEFDLTLKDAIGKTVFLTREEAEKKLEEMKNDNR